MGDKKEWLTLVVGHIPTQYLIDTNSRHENYHRLLKGFSLGEPVDYLSGNNRTPDFTSLGSMDVVNIAGHTHSDKTYNDGYLGIATASAQTEQQDLGTKNETCFDCYIIKKDEREIITKRFGYGDDRSFTY